MFMQRDCLQSLSCRHSWNSRLKPETPPLRSASVKHKNNFFISLNRQLINLMTWKSVALHISISKLFMFSLFFNWLCPCVRLSVAQWAFSKMRFILLQLEIHRENARESAIINVSIDGHRSSFITHWALFCSEV